jgi:predicted nucleic acid-binding protein
MFLLDTNVISELRKLRAGKADPNVAAWVRTVPAASLFLSVIVVQELEIGTLLAERRNPPQGAIVRAWLDEHVLSVFAERILPVDTAVACRSAALHVPDPGWIDRRERACPRHDRRHPERGRFRSHGRVSPQSVE